MNCFLLFFDMLVLIVIFLLYKEHLHSLLDWYLRTNNVIICYPDMFAANLVYIFVFRVVFVSFFFINPKFLIFLLLWLHLITHTFVLLCASTK